MANGLYYSSGRHLWRMVIYRAMQEAEGTYTIQPTTRTERAALPQLRARLRNEAKMWLTTDTLGLRRAFHFAQMPGPVGKRFQDFLENNRKRFGGRDE